MTFATAKILQIYQICKIYLKLFAYVDVFLYLCAINDANKEKMNMKKFREIAGYVLGGVMFVVLLPSNL